MAKKPVKGGVVTFQRLSLSVGVVTALRVYAEKFGRYPRTAMGKLEITDLISLIKANIYPRWALHQLEKRIVCLPPGWLLFLGCEDLLNLYFVAFKLKSDQLRLAALRALEKESVFLASVVNDKRWFEGAAVQSELVKIDRHRLMRILVRKAKKRDNFRTWDNLCKVCRPAIYPSDSVQSHLAFQGMLRSMSIPVEVSRVCQLSGLYPNPDYRRKIWQKVMRLFHGWIEKDRIDWLSTLADQGWPRSFILERDKLKEARWLTEEKVSKRRVWSEIKSSSTPKDLVERLKCPTLPEPLRVRALKLLVQMIGDDSEVYLDLCSNRGGSNVPHYVREEALSQLVARLEPEALGRKSKSR